MSRINLPMLAAVAEQQPSLLGAVSEREFQAMVVAHAKRRYWTVWSTWSSRHSPEGEPDLRLLSVIQRRHVWAELKTERGRLTDAQRVALEYLRRAGFEADVFRPRDAGRLVRILDGEERLSPDGD